MINQKTKQNKELYNLYAIEGEIGFFKEGNDDPIFIYDINKLNASQYFDAKMYFDMELTTIDNPPKELTEMKRVTDRQMPQKAFAAILMKPIYELDKDTNKVKRVGLEKYNSSSPVTLTALEDIMGPENILMLEKVKTDFFFRSGLLEKVLQKQIKSFSEQLAQLSPEEQKEMKDVLIDLSSSEK